MKTLFGAFLTIGLLGVLHVCGARYEDRFMDYRVYSIINRGLEPLRLTFQYQTRNVTDAKNQTVRVEPVPEIPPKVDNGGKDGQMWRLDKSALYTAFELRPVLDENFVLEYFPDQRILRWLSGFRNTKLWYLQDAGSNFTAIRHKGYDLCLEAVPGNKTVIAVACTGNVYQQWKLE